MFRFENPELLYFLFLLPLIAAAYLFYIFKKKKDFARMGNPGQIEQMIPDLSKGKPYVKMGLILTIFTCLIFAWANPQLGTSMVKVERKGIDLMIALDISNSMNCEDIQPSRLMRSKQAINNLIDKLHNDRIGLVIFAGDAVLQLPLTTDYGAAKLFVNNISTEDIANQGTSISAAIRSCIQSFDNNRSSTKDKAIIVISDGEDHEKDAVQAAREAYNNNIIVNTIGMGLPQGGPIPIYRNGKVISYQKDKQGTIVMTAINEDMLKEIASAGHGFYAGANNTSSGVNEIFKKLNELEKTTLETNSISDFQTIFYYPLLLALVLMILEIFIFEKRNKIFNRKNIFGSHTLKTMALVFFLGGIGFYSAHAQKAQLANKANKSYAKSEYGKAEEYLHKALALDSNYALAHYNLGNTYYQQKNYNQAIQHYTGIQSNNTLDKSQKADLYHNLGNALLETEQYQEAIESYKNALKLSPNDPDTKYNLAYALEMLKKQQQQQQQQQNQQNQNSKNNKDQQKQDQQNKDNDSQKDKQDQSNQQDSQQNPSDSKARQERQQNLQQKEAERMLKALENQEKETLKKIKKDKAGKSRNNEKNW